MAYCRLLRSTTVYYRILQNNVESLQYIYIYIYISFLIYSAKYKVRDLASFQEPVCLHFLGASRTQLKSLVCLVDTVLHSAILLYMIFWHAILQQRVDCTVAEYRKKVFAATHSRSALPKHSQLMHP